MECSKLSSSVDSEMSCFHRAFGTAQLMRCPHFRGPCMLVVALPSHLLFGSGGGLAKGAEVGILSMCEGVDCEW